MRLILDTHVFLWFVSGDERLKQPARSIIENSQNECLVSMASIWEITIKWSLNKLHFKAPIEEVLRKELQAFTLLNINSEHAIRVASLPLLHRDPFDRLLVAQCLCEELPLVSADTTLDAYEFSRYWTVFPNE